MSTTSLQLHLLVKKGQNSKIINVHDKTVIYTSRFVYIHQDFSSTSRFVYIHYDSCSSDIKQSKTAGSINVFSNGDRKMAANEEAANELRRVYRAITKEMTPASNVEKAGCRELILFSRVGAQQPPLCNP